MSDDDLLAIAIESEGGTSSLDEQSRMVLKASRHLADHPELPPQQLDALAAFLSPEHLVDLIFAIGFYVGLARFAMSLGLDLEPKYLPLLERYPIRPPLIA